MLERLFRLAEDTILEKFRDTLCIAELVIRFIRRIYDNASENGYFPGFATTGNDVVAMCGSNHICF